MDATPPTGSELSAASRWSGHASPHELAQVLSLLLPLLPLDCRARAACVSRAWRAAAAQPALWEELSFARCTARVDNAALAALCACAGAALRTLSLESDACKRVNATGMVAALHGGGCTGLRRLIRPLGPELLLDRSLYSLYLTSGEVQQLAAACPRLTHTACAVRCSLLNAAAAAAALPGPLLLKCYTGPDAAALTQLAECLCANTTLTSLSLRRSGIGDAIATQLAECLRVNTTLTSLSLIYNNIGAEGAAQLAECLRANTALTSLDLLGNDIRDAGATQLAECLRVNATLTSLSLSGNYISEAGATQLGQSLRINTTLTSLDLHENFIGEAGHQPESERQQHRRGGRDAADGVPARQRRAHEPGHG